MMLLLFINRLSLECHVVGAEDFFSEIQGKVGAVAGDFAKIPIEPAPFSDNFSYLIF
jgi:hypothetical protein